MWIWDDVGGVTYCFNYGFFELFGFKAGWITTIGLYPYPAETPLAGYGWFVGFT